MADGSEGPVVAIPMETKVRDLRGRLWLGMNLLEYGHTVVLGEEDSIKSGIDIVRPDIYCAGHARFTRERFELCRHLQQAGAKTVFLDPEGGVFITDELWKEDRLSERMMDLGEAYFAWGERQAEIIERDRPNFPGTVVVSGNPRFDLLHRGLREVYREEAEEITGRYGDFLLINTNFSEVNHANRDIDEQIADSSAYVTNLNKDYRLGLFEGFVDMAEHIAEAFPNQTILIRPHPSENHEPYRELAAAVENVAVEHSGDVRPWIMSANAVIHNSCTTGIESALLEVPVFAYRPIKNEQDDASLPNVVSDERKTVDALSIGLEASISGENTPYELDEEQRTALREYLFNIDEPVAGERIAETVESLEPTEVVPSALPNPNLVQWVGRVGTRYLGRENLARVLTLVPKNEVAYKRQKFPHLRRSELAHYCRLFDPFLNYDARSIEIEPVPDLSNTFVLSRD